MRDQLDIEQNIPLAPFTTLKIGGNARFFIRAKTEQRVVEAIAFAKKNCLPVFILGGGSNVLISDNGFDGLVLHVSIRSDQDETDIDAIKSESKLSRENAIQSTELVTVGAGENWDDFVADCVTRKLAGLECLSGIPGFVGGTPVQNVGAYGQEVSETIINVRCYDRDTGKIVTLRNYECGFTYRRSIFNSTHRDRYIVLNVTFELRTGSRSRVLYKDLVDHFSGRDPSISDVRDAVLKIRRAKSMVIASDDPNSKSAGSFFKNPMVSSDQLAEIEKVFARVPSFAVGERFKIPAAWLIEKAGFAKGFELGEAGISTNHTLALINRGNATSADIILLKERIQAVVAKKFRIHLDPEPVFVGFKL